MISRKIGIFTIASKNYLAYVRVLLKSVAELHPDYKLYLCLADEIDGAFDPQGEVFQVIQSDRIGMPYFEDMVLRYDIMEFNTAIKPFMFQWLLNNTGLDSIIYLDPDIRVYSRLDRLEDVLSSEVSVVLTPHITKPIEDCKNPNDYHMLQAGVFNLGFAAINRCKEATDFVGWWGRRLETQAEADFARNLFTDQRWCDLAPCFLDRLHVLKRPGYNVAYWNLTERSVSHVRGQWQVNGEPLTFFHFSGVNPSKENVISKHQNRFDWSSVPNCKPLFDEYRGSLIKEGWEKSKGWEYVYSKTKEGLRIPPIVRRLYKANYPDSQLFQGTNATEKILSVCNASSGTTLLDQAVPITRLMFAVHSSRPDLQAAFNLENHDQRVDFHNWYASSGVREYDLTSEFVPPRPNLVPQLDASTKRRDQVSATSVQAAIGKIPPSRKTDTEIQYNDSINLADVWVGFPEPVKRLLSPIVLRILEVRAVPSRRIDSLHYPARIPQLLDNGRYISMLMFMIWTSRPDLQVAFDLATTEGQMAFVGWFAESARREYGVGAIQPRDAACVGDAVTSASQSTRLLSVPGANLIGYAHGELGMGEHVRMSAAALERTSVRFGVVNFNVGVSSRQGATLEHGKLIRNNPFAANIFHINADQMLLAYCHLGHDFFAGKYNIGYWAWELSKCPDEWLPVLELMDEVWAPSKFIQEAFAGQSNIPVVYMPLCVTLPDFDRLGRAYFGLPNPAFIFLYTFDFFSFLDRKNPFAAIRAFQKAFPNRSSDVCLVLKVMNGRADSPLWIEMINLIGDDCRVVIINRTLSRGEVLALFDVSDCFVSLHRSEGFGRGPAEAMYLGKPVIVTNYSGNTDFTLADNACLVDFKLIPVAEGQYPFHQGQHWADPDVDQAAWYMRRLQGNREYSHELGARGRAHIHKNFSQEAIGAMYESRLTNIGLG